MLQKLNQLKSREQGFTIIEVLIVLAIAGLILLIVFLAVPALQRASRNTDRKNDVSALGSAISNFIDDNDGQTPNSGTYADGTITICDNADLNGTCDSSSGNTEQAKVGYYSVSPEFFTTVPANSPDSDSIDVVVGYTCNSDGTGLDTTTPEARSVAILYATESGSGNTASQCTEAA